MPGHGSPHQREPRRRPLWLRYLLAIGVAVALLLALVIYVSAHNTDSPRSSDPAAALQANREAEILVEQDQAPHMTVLPRGRAPARELSLVLRAYMNRRIARGEIEGPVQRVSCHPADASAGPRTAFRCSVEAGHVNYPFRAVVDGAARRIIYCKRDPPPAPSDDTPISPRCQR